MPITTLEKAYRAHFSLPETEALVVSAIKKGASGRTIVKIQGDTTPEVIAIHYTFDRDDNALHKPISDLLENAGVRVPHILLADLDTQVLLVEYIGNQDFLSLKEQPFSERLPYYREVFTQLAKLSRVAVPAGYDIMPPFTAETYRWEQEYFATHYLGTHLGKDVEAFLGHPLITELELSLGSHQPDLVHRDFQSQNLMLRNGEVYVIDFQGARLGYQEYDIASFIYDPYMQHSFAECERLLALWEEVSGGPLNSKLLLQCAMQRLMQALGAYGNIVYNQKDDWYAQHMVPASEMLLALTKETEYETLFHSLLN